MSRRAVRDRMWLLAALAGLALGCAGCGTSHALYPDKKEQFLVTTGDANDAIIAPGYDTVGEIRLTETGFTLLFIPFAVSYTHLTLPTN